MPHNTPHDANEAAEHRIVRVWNRSTQRTDSYIGDQVYSVTEKGIVIALNAQRLLIPWHNVTEFVYHTLDTAARKVVQGY